MKKRMIAILLIFVMLCGMAAAEGAEFNGLCADVIVVGADVAGLAAVTAGEAGKTVIVLEAGGASGAAEAPTGTLSCWTRR